MDKSLSTTEPQLPPLTPLVAHVPVMVLLAYALYRNVTIPGLEALALTTALAGALGSYAYSIAGLRLRTPLAADIDKLSQPKWWLIPLRAALASVVAPFAFGLFANLINAAPTAALFGFVVGFYSSVLMEAAGAWRSARGARKTAAAAIEVVQAPTISQTVEDRSDEDPVVQEQLAKRPVDPAVVLRLIDDMRGKKRYRGAAVLYDRLIAERPRDYALIVQKAQLYQEMGDLRRYNETIRQAERIQADASFEQNVGSSLTVVEAEVRGLQFFGDFIWPLQPNVNVLLGKNGYGKSHLLRALVATLQNDQEVTQEFVDHSRSEAMIRVDVRRGDAVVRTVRRPLVFEETFGKVPVLAIPDMRYIEKADDSIGPSSSSVVDLRGQGAEHFMRDRSFQSVILTFLYELCIDYFDRGKTFDVPVFRLIEKTLQDLTGSTFRFHDIRRRDNARFEIQVLTEGNESTPLPLQKASQGTLSIVCIAGLIYRYLAKLYPNVPETGIARQQAIVVIDEIDAHLHPVWQQKVLQLFRDTFPNVQFILTAHTPLVVAGCRSHEVSVLQRTPGGFAVQVMPQHFIGATAANMYQQIFDVEEKDLAFLRLKTLVPQKGNIEKEVAKLEVRETLSDEQESTLRGLKSQLYYLREVEQMTAQRAKLENAEHERQALELRVMDLRGEVANLKAELERKTEVVESSDLSGLVNFVRQFVEANRERAEIVEPFIKHLSRQGGNKEAASLLEVLLQSEPANLNYLKGLAVQYQALGDNAKAADVLRRAQKAFPSDEGVQAALRRLDVVQGRATATES